MTPDSAPETRRARSAHTSLSARGEPYIWLLGGALAGGVLMIAGFLLLIAWSGFKAFWPGPIHEITLKEGVVIAGELARTETYVPSPAGSGADILLESKTRFLYRLGNFDLTGEDFKWVNEEEIQSAGLPGDILFMERLEWGPFIGRLVSITSGGKEIPARQWDEARLEKLLEEAQARRDALMDIQRGKMGRINSRMEKLRLSLRKAEMDEPAASPKLARIREEAEKRTAALESEHATLALQAQKLDSEDAALTITLAAASGGQKTIRQSQAARIYFPNRIGFFGKARVYISRWAEFLTQEPREANTEGGVWPAIFGTFVMTLLMALLVAPFGVIAALYLREYAKQGWLVSLVRVCVNNMAGVPSIVYGIFGLGFFAYGAGGWIDGFFFQERLPSPTFGTGGILWASLTLALLTAPVVIVAAEEAISSVPQSAREGSLACGASHWQTIRHIVLPQAMPGIMTGVILAMARGAGEVAPLMLVGVVKLAPELPVDSIFPYIHLERSFMCLGFHIYDVGFQSRNAEAGKPIVFMTTLLLMAVVASLNAGAIIARNRLRARHASGHF